jgi:hypothetical protein
MVSNDAVADIPTSARNTALGGLRRSGRPLPSSGQILESLFLNVLRALTLAVYAVLGTLVALALFGFTVGLLWPGLVQ